MARSRWQYILLFLTLLSAALAASPTSFCKCTCFTNSTIIPLNNTIANLPSSSDNTTSPSSRRQTCTDCTKKFCLDSNLAICADATETDVFTTCFQRDSAKDEAIIYIFIVATVGLLVGAVVKPLVVRWAERFKGRGRYAFLRGEGR